MTSNIVVLGFEAKFGAQGMLDDLHRWEEEGVIKVDDAVIAFAGRDGTVEIIHPHRSEKGKFALRGGAVGLVAGALLGGPILGLVAGVAAGVLKGKSKDNPGLDGEFVQEVSGWVRPGRSALFLLVKEGNADELQARLKPLKATILTTTLAPEKEQALRQALAEEEYDL
jgi:uncharacterized membrane protein